MKFRGVAVGLAAVLVATVLAPIAVSSPVQAQSQTDWLINDEPTLFGPQDGWRHGNAGHGYGTNNYRYTYGIGGASSAANWAHWYMGRRVGRQDIQVYVPSNHATATVNYNIYIDGREFKSQVAQQGVSGWHSLGRWNTNGGDVTVAVFDNDVLQHYERDGIALSSIGVDAVAMRCVENCTEPGASVPGAPRNLRLTRVDADSFRFAWDPPRSDGGAAITRYTVTISRPAISSSVPAWENTYSDGSSERSRTLNGRRGATYTVRLAAINHVGLGPYVTGIYATDPEPISVPPPKPVDLFVFGPDDLASTRPHLRATWSVPGGTRTAGLRYEVRISRDSIGGDGGWRFSRTTGNQHSTIGPLRAGVAYTVRVTTINSSGRRSATAIYDDVVALERPLVSLANEGRSWIFDDRDAVVSWSRVRGASEYQVDWRYMKIGTDRLREIYAELKKGGLTPARRDQLTTEASKILAGTEVSASEIGGASRPHSDPNYPEVHCSVQSKTCYIQTTASLESWDPAEPEFRIDSRNDNYVLQARVRATGPRLSRGGWSGWAFHPDAKFAAGCRALEYYDNIKTILRAVDIAGWVVTAAGVAGAAFSGGSSVVLSTSAKEILKAIAKKVIRDVTIKRVLVNIVKEAVKQGLRSTGKELLGFTFGCATYGLGLKAAQSEELGKSIIEGVWDEIGDEFPDSVKDEILDIPW